MYIGLHVKYPLVLSNLNGTEFSRQIFVKNPKKQHFMKIRPVGAELFHADRQTHMTKLIEIRAKGSMYISPC
jgi:hypothetical protein